MNNADDDRTLARAASDLSGQVRLLASRLSVSQRQVARMRWLTVLTAGLAVLAVIGGVVSILLWQQVQATSNDHQRSAVQVCRNTNEVREANTKLWDFIIDVSSASNPDRTAAERVQLERIRVWIGQLYRPHDCSDLSKKYPVPDPPPILRGRS